MTDEVESQTRLRRWDVSPRPARRHTEDLPPQTLTLASRLGPREGHKNQVVFEVWPGFPDFQAPRNTRNLDGRGMGYARPFPLGRVTARTVNKGAPRDSPHFLGCRELYSHSLTSATNPTH